MRPVHFPATKKLPDIKIQLIKSFLFWEKQSEVVVCILVTTLSKTKENPLWLTQLFSLAVTSCSWAPTNSLLSKLVQAAIQNTINWTAYKQQKFRTSGQYSGIGKHGLSPRTTTSKLQLNHRTTITQNHLKYSWMEVWQLQNQRNHIHPDWYKGQRHGMSWSHIHVWWIKFGRDISGAKSPSPILGPPAQGSNARKVSPHNFCLQKPAENDLVEDTCRAPSSSP